MSFYTARVQSGPWAVASLMSASDQRHVVNMKLYYSNYETLLLSYNKDSNASMTNNLLQKTYSKGHQSLNSR